MKPFSLLLSMLMLVAGALIGRGSVLASPGPNSVTATLGASLHVVVSAPGTAYRTGTAVPITVRITNDSSRYTALIRWSCHQFAQLHYVSTPRFDGNPTEDLGPVLLVHAPRECGGAIGVMRRHHTWTMQQDVVLSHRYLAAQFDLVVHNVDRPGTVDMPVFTPVLSFTLIRGRGK